MGRPIIKFLTDFGPLLIFFIIYFKNGQNLKLAIPPFVITTLLSLAIIYVLDKKIPMMPLTSGIIITLFGGLTLYFDNKIFFYMKPTMVNLLFAFVLFFGSFFLKKNLLKSLLESSIQLEERGWELLNKRWMIFFIFLAFLNEIIWRTQTEDFWVKFKVFGIIPITFIFMIFQINLIKKYKINV